MYQVKILEKENLQVVEVLNNVTFEVAEKIELSYKKDSFYLVSIRRMPRVF
jgi:hypothetical protein